MPNYFDQFDAHPAAPPAGPAQSGNFFDQFDEAPANAAPASTERPNYAVDTLKSFGSGIVRGGAEMAMLPVTAHRLAQQGSDYLYDKGDAMVRALFGMPAADPAQRAAVDAARAGSYAGKMDSAIYGAQDSARGAMDSVLHTPETTPGKFAQTIGEFVAPGGLPSDAARAAPTLIRKGAQYAADLGRTAFIPGVASEGAGQVTEGTSAEPYARVLAAIVANAGVGLSQAANTPEAMLRRAAGPADQIDWARALGLQDNTTGIRLADRYSKAATETQGGNRDFAGAKFHQNVAGNDQRRSTLDAVLGALPSPEAMNTSPELLDVLQATGRRMPIGSATDFNSSARADLSAASPAARVLGLVKSLGTSLVTNTGAALNRSAYKSSINTLADMFVDPKSVELIRDALGRSHSNGLAEAAARSAAQAPAIMGQRRQ